MVVKGLANKRGRTMLISSSFSGNGGKYDAGLARSTKIRAYEEAARIIDGSLSGDLFSAVEKDHFRCALLMPSMDCNDLRSFRKYFDGKTKFIVVENMEYIRDTRWVSFQENFLEKMDELGLPRENALFHRGDLRSVNLQYYLGRLGERKVDFLFADTCDALFDWDIVNFFWCGRDCIAGADEGGFVLMTKSLQPRNNMHRNAMEALNRIRKDNDYEKHSGCVTISGERANRIGGKIRDMAVIRSWQIWHLLNCRPIPKENVFDTIVYNGGSEETTKMGLFIVQKIEKEAEESVHQHYASIIVSDSSALNRCDVVASSNIRRSCRKFTDGDRALVDDEKRFEKGSYNLLGLFDYLFKVDGTPPRKNRRFDADRIHERLKSVFHDGYPSQMYQNTLRGSELDYTLKENLLEKYYIGRTFEWKGKKISVSWGRKMRRRRKVIVSLVKPDGAVVLNPGNYVAELGL